MLYIINIYIFIYTTERGRKRKGGGKETFMLSNAKHYKWQTLNLKDYYIYPWT